MRYFAFLFLALICFSCNKTDDNYKPIDITVSLNDDVSPLKAEFSIPGEYDFIQWTLEGTTSVTDFNINPITAIYSKTGQATIKVIAYNNSTGKQVTGTKEIVIPRVARRLKLSGISFRDAASAELFNQKQLSVTLEYTAFGQSTRKVFTYPARNVTQNDILPFPEDVIYDINGFETGTMNNHYLMVKVYSMPQNTQIFGCGFSLTSEYFSMHAVLPDAIQVSNVIAGGSNLIYIPCDWLPQ